LWPIPVFFGEAPGCIGLNNRLLYFLVSPNLEKMLLIVFYQEDDIVVNTLFS